LQNLIVEMCWMIIFCNVFFKILNIIQSVIHMLQSVHWRNIHLHSEQTKWATISWKKSWAECRNFEQSSSSEVSTSICQSQYWNHVTAMMFFETEWLNKLKFASSHMIHSIWLIDIQSCDWQKCICKWKFVNRIEWLNLT